jgi:rRNA-processing protein FCF1
MKPFIRKKNILIADANFLIYAVINKIDLTQLYDILEGAIIIATTWKVKKELENMAKRKTKEGTAAVIANKMELTVFKEKGRNADEEIINVAYGLKAKEDNEILNIYLLTHDKKLIKKAKEKGINVILIKGKGKVDFL